MKGMASELVFLSLLACGYAQLIYPDQFEMMRTSTIPPPTYFYSPNSRQSKVNPSSFGSIANDPQSISLADEPLSPQYVQDYPVSLSGVAYQQAVPTAQPVYPENRLQNWGHHVNDVIVKGVTKFTLDIERQIYRTQSTTTPGYRENVIFSPLSLSATLAMVLLGSAGRTFDEVSKILGLETGIDISQHSEIVHQMFGVLLSQVHGKIVGSSGPRVDFASGIFVQDGYSIRPEFQAICEYVYKSEVLKLDFIRRGKEAQEKVNTWVKQKTMGKISNILSYPPDPSTNVILISALYFNGEWNQHFLAGATKRRPFFIEPNESVDIDMMYNGGPFPFYEDKQLGVKMLALPYKGFEISMYILLPTAKGAVALRNFQNQLTPDILESLINNLKNETCIVGLPRMKLSSTISLTSALKSLGLTSLFDPTTADLSLLSQGYGEQMMSSMTPPMSPTVIVPMVPRTPTVPTVAPLPPVTRPGKSNVGQNAISDKNDIIIFPRFGTDEPSDAMRRNYFSYVDKVRGLTVEQWSTGFSIGRTRGLRSVKDENNEKSQEQSHKNRNSYVVNEAQQNQGDTKVVKLEQNKYRFQGKEQGARRKRQSRPIDQSFLNYIKSQNFPSYGLDNLRNSGNLVNPHLYASDVLHKVEIDITEKGTEAAAATAVLLERDGNQKRLIANRPFLFFIRHNPSRLLLFWGTLNTPTPNYLVT